MRPSLPELIIACLLAHGANAQTWQWAERGGGSNSSTGNAIDVDELGNSFITGTFHGSITFGNITLTDVAATSIYLAAYDANGAVLWARLAANGVVIDVNGLTRDPSGHITIVGQYLGSAAFGDAAPVTVTSGGDHDVFIARFTSTGDLDWVRSFGGAGYDFGIGISHDANGNLYATGDLHYGSFSGSASKVYVVKYAPNGDQLWLKLPPDYSNFHIGNGIQTDDAGNSYVVGNFFDSITFDPVTINAGNIESNFFLAKVDADGNGVWAVPGGAGSGYCGGRAVDIDAAGNAYITGDFHGTIDLGSLSISSSPSETFVAKCNSDGVFLWANHAEGPGSCFSRAIAVDGAGSCFLSGVFNTSIFFNATELIPTSTSDMFVTKVDGAGEFTWATAAHSTTGIGVGGMKANGLGVFIAGAISGTTDFGGSIQLVSGAASDVFAARLHDDDTGVEESDGSSPLRIFPNPAGDHIRITGIAANELCSIYDVRGVLVRMTMVDDTRPIDISSLRPGEYFIRLPRGGNSRGYVEQRFVKVR